MSGGKPQHLPELPHAKWGEKILTIPLPPFQISPSSISFLFSSTIPPNLAWFVEPLGRSLDTDNLFPTASELKDDTRNLEEPPDLSFPEQPRSLLSQSELLGAKSFHLRQGIPTPYYK
ncbi:hypothetical protein NL676_018110 [Syzygium grande]|nr:hypothetical protein NL676_018110 [Syzygium grande]